ncbi:MAG TPA: AraC family transcriptional regulator [Puia sp.]|jgi:AraC-like DNA-binding protein|nr:AraC family transcriptional regulator [Puia sp.]
MKSQHPVQSARALHWQQLQLPVGLQAAAIKVSVDGLDLAQPIFDPNGLVLTFINHKGDLHVRPAGRPQNEEQPASPGLGLLSLASQPLLYRSSAPILFSALVLYIPAAWTSLFLRDNVQFQKIGQTLEQDGNIITCRLGRRQMSLFSAALNLMQDNQQDLLSIQNDLLSLLEYFLCNRHRSLLGVNPSSDIENEDDLTLIREVESYISEYYCSDTFTVDSILKKTYTSYHRLNFLFKSIHGMTISEYIRNKRIERSKEMIADNAKSISQIAYEIGYSSISNYILAFKKVYQITPGKYKKQMDNMV